MKPFRKILEYIWPLLDSREDTGNKLQDDFPETNNWDDKYKLLKEISSREEDRLKTVESKSAIFIGTMSVATSVIIASFSILSISKSGKNLIHIYIISFVLVIYLLRTLWFSIKALKREVYAYISINEICNTNSPDYYKILSQELIKSIRINQKAINSKVDSMVMAQEYFKRVIWCIGIYAFCIILLCITS